MNWGATIERIFEQFNKSFDEIFDNLFEYPRELLVLKFSLILFLLHAHTNWTLEMPLRILCTFMLISDYLIKSRLLWVLLCVLITYINASQWYIIDNHQFLITYWCIVCTLSVFSQDSFFLLQKNALWLIALTFIFATFWKLFSMEYYNGKFLHFQMLTDDRLKMLALLGSDIAEKSLEYNYDLYKMFKYEPNSSLYAPFLTTSGLKKFSLAFSYLTLAIEGGIAISFTFAKNRWLYRIKDWLLIGFIVITYFTIPVLAFGFILMILGIAQLEKDNRTLFAGYLVCFIILQLTFIPVDKILISFLNNF